MEWVLSVAVPRPLDGLFTYRVPEHLRERVVVGGWVRVPFGRSVTHAFVVEPPKPLTDAVKWELKDILEVGVSELPEDILDLCRFAHDYYQAPFGEVLGCAISPKVLQGLAKGMKARVKGKEEGSLAKSAPKVAILTADQSRALAELEAARARGHSVSLLHGVTGSGKTEIYLELARRTLAEGRGVLVLVPEIALTPQLHARFEAAVGEPVGLWHSAVPDGQRVEQWRALRSGSLRVIVGARSSVFAPIHGLGLIVIDEEHDTSYKQEDRVRYHARDLAIVRAKKTKAAVVLGSATPSLEALERVREGKFTHVKLEQRYGSSGMPSIECVDLTQEPLVQGTQAILAERTVQAIRDTIASGEQVMVFLNRRGFAAFLLCQDCGHVAECHQCSVSLTVHKRARELRCHVCGWFEPVPDTCPKCQGDRLAPMGAGTESLEEELPRLIPEVKALRLDRDQITSTSRLVKVLSDFRDQKANVMLGTQMLVKGHDFPSVTLVVVLLADALFRWPDFRAPERALQLLTQVSGRAGRADRPGRVLVQTFSPGHPVLEVLMGRLTVDSFLESERELRQALSYPPFGRLARLRMECLLQEDARQQSTGLADALNQAVREGGYGELTILGPSEALLERIKGVYRWDLLVKAREVGSLQKLVRLARRLAIEKRWSLTVDVDPSSIG